MTSVTKSDRDGIVKVGLKGSTILIDDDTLAYAESAGKKTLRNLQQNPQVAVLILDLERREGSQFKGNAEFVKEGPLFERISERQKETNRPLPKAVVKIHIADIYRFKTGVPSARRMTPLEKTLSEIMLMEVERTWLWKPTLNVQGANTFTTFISSSMTRGRIFRCTVQSAWRSFQGKKGR